MELVLATTADQQKQHTVNAITSSALTRKRLQLKTLTVSYRTGIVMTIGFLKMMYSDVLTVFDCQSTACISSLSNLGVA